jgi:hypothetical protein
MGFDPAENKEVPVPSSSSGSSGTGQDEISIAKDKELDDRRGTIHTTKTAEDDEGSPEIPVLKHTNTHTLGHLGHLTMRAVDDDNPS